MFKEKGYHGTLSYRADNILKHGFRPSKKDNEWLGTGIYFFGDIKWAKDWALQETARNNLPNNQATVLSAILNCDDDEFLNLDDPKEMERLKKELDKLANLYNPKGHPNTQRAETRCLICNFWKRKYGTKIIAYTFPKMQHNSLGFPISVSQKQYCVTSKESIKFVSVEDIEGGTDYAI